MKALVWNGTGFDERESSDSRYDGLYLLPGLVDTHVHGALGWDFMSGQGDQVIRSLREIGVEYVCLTSVTSPWEELRNAIDSVNPDEAGFCGFHLEGPYLNPKMAGAQPDFFLEPDANQLSAELGDRLEKVRIVSFAPELQGGTEFARSLFKWGIVVSAGHTDASFEMLEECRPNRLTHFLNAMRRFHHREPGPIDYGLTKNVDVELIYDRVHFSDEAAEMVVKSKSVLQLIGISDGTQLSGLPDGTDAMIWGQKVRKADGSVRLMNGNLAGSGSTLVEVFKNFWRKFGPVVATFACSVNPRRSLGLPEPEMWLCVAKDGTIENIVTGAIQL